MLGWHISVFRLPDGGVRPARLDAVAGARIAVWQTGLYGLDWIDELVARGDALHLRGDGYPSRYSARLRHLIGPIRDDLPDAHDTWISGAGDVIDRSKWPGRTTIDEEVLASCDLDEWTLIEAWDES